MIYKYEGEILKFINKCIPTIDTATYSKQEELFNAMVNVKKFPMFYYSRDTDNWGNDKEMTILEDDGSKTKFVLMPQSYTGTILVEDVMTQQEIAEKLRFYWHKNPYIYVSWPDSQSRLKVALRLLYIKIDELRRADDKKGACRIVEFKWSSNLFMADMSEAKSVLVEKVRIYIDNDGNPTVEDINNNNLIKEING